MKEGTRQKHGHPLGLSKLLSRPEHGQEEETDKDSLEEHVHYLMKTKVFFPAGIDLSQYDSPPQQR